MNKPILSNKVAECGLTNVQVAIEDMCLEIATLLIGKNRAYGNSIFDPMRVFSKASWEEAVNVRCDDKLSRLARGEAAGEDAELDLIGYLILKRVGKRLFSGSGVELCSNAPR